MRTAVCISGRCSRLMEDYSSVKQHIIDPYRADVFISTWKGECTDQLEKVYQPIVCEVEELEKSELWVHVEHIMTNPPVFKGYGGEVAGEHKDDNKRRMFYMFYKIWKCNELKKAYEHKHAFSYDTVIRLRFELFIKQFPVIDPAPNTIYIPNCHDYRKGYNDQIAIGDSEAMDKYASLHSRMDQWIAEGQPLHPESANRKNIEVQGMNVERFNAKYLLQGR